ncbi:MAG: replication initiation factor domain-containing protein [Phycisphaerales bacterium]
MKSTPSVPGIDPTTSATSRDGLGLDHAVRVGADAAGRSTEPREAVGYAAPAVVSGAPLVCTSTKMPPRLDGGQPNDFSTSYPRVLIDWLTARFRVGQNGLTAAAWAHHRTQIMAHLRTATGEDGLDDGLLRRGLHAQTWPGVMFAANERGGFIEVRGEGCELLGMRAMLALLRFMRGLTGASVTRLDVALDFEPAPVRLIDDIIEACSLKQMRLLRSWRPTEERSASGELTGRAVNLGKGSVMVCIYDRGLLNSTHTAGEYLRFETRFRHARADQTALSLIAATEPIATAAHAALSVVDFREGPAGDGQHWRRQPRLQWFAALAGELQHVRPVTARLESTFEKWRQAFYRQYGNAIVSAARAANMPIGAALAALLLPESLGEGEDGAPLRPLTPAALRLAEALRSWLAAPEVVERVVAVVPPITLVPLEAAGTVIAPRVAAPAQTAFLVSGPDLFKHPLLAWHPAQ